MTSGAGHVTQIFAEPKHDVVDFAGCGDSGIDLKVIGTCGKGRVASRL